MFIAQILIFLSVFMPHELHLSMSNISYNQEYNRIEIQQRVFYDDLESSLRNLLKNQEFNILQPSNSSYDYDSLFTNYLNQHIQLSIDKKDIALELLEYELDNDAFVFFLYAENINEVPSINLHSTILFEMFENQTNIVSANINGIKKSEKFRKGSKSIQLTF